MKDDLMDVGVSSSLYSHRKGRETQSYEQIGSTVGSEEGLKDFAHKQWIMCHQELT